MLSAVAALLIAAAATDTSVFHSEDPARWGRPKRVLPPEFPAEALQRGASGYVDIDGTIGHHLMLEGISFHPGSEEARIFIAPLQKALPFWTFEQPLGNDCLPTFESVRTRVWFEIEEGKPKISVSHRPTERKERTVKFKPIHRETPAYPHSARRQGTEAIVYMRLVMNAEGEITESTGKAYPETSGVATLVRAAHAATMRWKFAPEGLEGLEGKGAILCYQFNFRLTN